MTALQLEYQRPRWGTDSDGSLLAGKPTHPNYLNLTDFSGP
jgi:hypothetical protein